MSQSEASPKVNSYGSAQRRKALLHAISAYLDHAGLINFSFRGAAKAAGIGPTTLTRYFGSRDDLLDALLAHAMAEMFSRVNETSAVDPRQDLIGYYRQLIADPDSILYDRDWNRPWHQLAALSESPMAPAAMRSRYLRAWHHGLANEIEILRANGAPAKLAKSLGRTFYSCKRGIHRDYCLHEDHQAARLDYDRLTSWLESSLNGQAPS